MKRKRMLSPTAINTYLRCPNKYYLRYIKRLKSKPSIHLVKGIAVHEALAKFYDLKPDGDSFVSELRLKLVDLFRKEWSKQQPTIDKLSLSDNELNEHYTQCVNMLYAWFYRYMEQASLGLDRPETEVKLFARKYNLMGIVDVIHDEGGKITLIDYKTSAKDTVTKEMKIQMALYVLLYKENFGKLPDRVVLDFLATGSKRMYPVNADMLKWAKSLCWDVGQKTMSDDPKDYPCTCGGWCEKDFLQDDEHKPGQGYPKAA